MLWSIRQLKFHFYPGSRHLGVEDGGGNTMFCFCPHVSLTRYGKKIVFIWVPGHVGIRGNLAADSAAKDAIIGDISVELIPFSDLKSHANKYILELWQSELDEFLEN